MEKHYIAPTLTVVAIHVERGYADSIPASADNIKLGLGDLTTNCSGNTPEERSVSSNWREDNNGFWESSY